MLLVLRNAFIISMLLLIHSAIFGQLNLQRISIPQNIKEGDFKIYVAEKEEEDHHEYYSCSWDMGDGVNRVMLNQFEVGHTYRDDGNYTIHLNVRDSEDRTVSISQSVKVENVAPEIRYFEGKVTNSANAKMEFEAIAYDPGNDELTYEWDFGDGNSRNTGTRNKVYHVYSEPGVYTVRVTVDDGDGGTDYETTTISVEYDWHATITGDYNFNLAGGASLMYQTRIDTITKEVVSCFKVFTFFDDNNRSYLTLGSKAFERLADNSHDIGNYSDDLFDLRFSYDMKESMYANNSMFFRMQDVQNDFMSVSSQSFKSLSLLSDMREAINTGENLYGIVFEDISGTLEIEPLKGNQLKGNLESDMETRIDVGNGERINKYIHISLEFNVKINKVTKFNMDAGCEEEPDPFFITDYSPRDGKVNVNTETPCINIAFSEAVDPLSVNVSNIKLGYYNVSDQFVLENYATSITESNEIKIIPASPLRSGVIYEIKVVEGDNGIRSLDGGKLNEGILIKFSTIVLPTIFESRIYQSVADAPLIEGKNTLVRLEYEWPKPSDLHEKSFVKEFPASIKLKTEGGLNLVHSDIIKNQLYYSEDEVRNAENSINIYSWKPKPSDGNNLEIILTPDFQDCYEGEKEAFTIMHSIKHTNIKANLKLDYYIVKKSEFEIIEEDKFRNWIDFINKNVNFSKQIYPVYDIQSNYKGTITPFFIDQTIDSTFYVRFRESIPWGESVREGVNEHNESILVYLKNYLYQFYISTSTADVNVFLMDLDLGSPGLTIRDRNDFFGNEFIYVEYKEGQEIRPILVHELGHSFYLEHIPYVADTREREISSYLPFDYWENDTDHLHINGFRISSNGHFGYNKNCLEGNAESQYLTNIMFPHAKRVFYDEPWINHDQYLDVLEHFDLSGKGFSSINLFNQNNYEFASLNKISNPDSQKKTILISAIYNKLEEQFGIIFSNESNKVYPDVDNNDGNYLVKILNDKGETLAEKKFKIDDDNHYCLDSSENNLLNLNISIKVPAESKTRTIQILKGKEILTDYLISDKEPVILPDLRIKKDSNDLNRLNVEWKSFDEDDDLLVHSIYYSSGELLEWIPLGFTTNKRFSFSTLDLPSGSAPTIKIVASDGYHSDEAMIPLNIDFPFEINYMSPDDTITKGDELKIMFSNAVIPEQEANQWFKFMSTDPDGFKKPVSYEVAYNDDYKSITLVPHQALKSGYQYEISYGIKPPEPVSEVNSKNKAKQKKRKNPIKEFLAKQVDKLTADNPDKEDANFLKEMLGLPTDPIPEEEKDNQHDEKKEDFDLKERLGLNLDNEEKIYLIKDIFGNELSGYYSVQFQVR